LTELQESNRRDQTLGDANECWSWRVVRDTLKQEFGEGYFILKGHDIFKGGKVIPPNVYALLKHRAAEHGIKNLIVGFVNSQMFTADDDNHEPEAQFHCNAADFSVNIWSEPYRLAKAGEINRGINYIEHDNSQDQNKPFLYGGTPENRWHHYITAIYDFKMCPDGDAREQMKEIYDKNAIDDFLNSLESMEESEEANPGRPINHSSSSSSSSSGQPAQPSSGSIIVARSTEETVRMLNSGRGAMTRSRSINAIEKTV